MRGTKPGRKANVDNWAPLLNQLFKGAYVFMHIQLGGRAVAAIFNAMVEVVRFFLGTVVQFGFAIQQIGKTKTEKIMLLIVGIHPVGARVADNQGFVFCHNLLLFLFVFFIIFFVVLFIVLFHWHMQYRFFGNPKDTAFLPANERYKCFGKFLHMCFCISYS